MRITIIEADRPDDAVRHRYPSYGGMCADWLGAALPEARFELVNVAEGAAFPPVDRFDGLLLTGSRAGAYEEHPWIPPYEALLRNARDAGRPIGGICFGHQIMAQAFGGRVEKSARGWAIGRKTHRVAAEGRDLFAGRDEIAVLSFHQDQVTALPPGSRVILGNDQSPHGGLDYPFAALSVQFHPEFAQDYVAGLLDRADPADIPADVMAESRRSLTGALDNAEVARAFARFYRRAMQR